MDSAAYRELQIVPWNIVRYNMLSGGGRGPNIFGTEPWWFYFLNLALNFNVCTIAAFLSVPLAVSIATNSRLITRRFSASL